MCVYISNDSLLKKYTGSKTQTENESVHVPDLVFIIGVSGLLESYFFVSGLVFVSISTD